MNKKQQKEFLEAAEIIMSQKKITRDELRQYLIDVFQKAFGRNYDELPEQYREFISDIEDADIIVDIDLDKFIFEIKRRWIINNGLIPMEKFFREININSETVLDKSLSEGSEYIIDIDLEDISDSKRRQITQLLIQRSKEKEKEKVLYKYEQLIGNVVTAKVYEVKPTFTLLSYDEDILFLSNYEKSPLDNFNEGDYIKVFITEVTKQNKNTQISVSRTRPQFIIGLLKDENEDIANGTVTIERIAREIGVKTKIAVKSKNPAIDSVGSIIGPKGSKIRNIINEINNEIIDVVEFSEDPKMLIKNLFHPAKVKGIYTDEENRIAAVLVEDNELLQAIGKNGVNVKLVAKITGFKIDVVPRSKEGKVEFVFENIQNLAKPKTNPNFELEVKSIDELIEDGDKLEEEDVDYYDWFEDEEEQAK